MTKIQRKKHIECLKEVLVSQGYRPDRWGNFVHPSNPGVRFKFKKVNLRMETKSGKTWFRIAGGVLTKITSSLMLTLVKKGKKQIAPGPSALIVS